MTEMVASGPLITGSTDRLGISVGQVSTYRYRLGTRCGLVNHS